MRDGIGTGAVPLAFLLLLVACRDAAPAFEPDDRIGVEGSEPNRLTFSQYDDRAPSWNATSDTIYYSGYSEDYKPSAPAMILAVSRDGGVARPALRNVQEGAFRGRWLFAPVVSPSGTRVALLELGLLRPEWPCAGDTVAFCPYEHYASPRLEKAILRVRDIRAEHAITDDPAVTLEFAGTERDSIDAVPGYRTWSSRYHPFQFDYILHGDYPSRPSWSPDERLLATSDGLRLLLWEPETGAVDPIPGTGDGTAPAWSPDGNWIAYTFTERLDSASAVCLIGLVIETPAGPAGVPECFEVRTMYETAPPRVVLVRPDGSERRVIAEGRDPAWAADGTLFFAAADGIGPLQRYDPATDATTTIPDTEGAREPAASPDGARIAFSRARAPESPQPGAPPPTRDIYVAPLP